MPMSFEEARAEPERRAPIAWVRWLNHITRDVWESGARVTNYRGHGRLDGFTLCIDIADGEERYTLRMEGLDPINCLDAWDFPAVPTAEPEIMARREGRAADLPQPQHRSQATLSGPRWGISASPAPSRRGNNVQAMRQYGTPGRPTGLLSKLSY